ncbi:MAG: hypothetical protein ABEI11_02755 [Haloarculaceae archaeon]
MGPTSRRGLLAAAGAAAGVALAGCLSGGDGEPRYRLSASNVPGSLADAFRWEPRGPYAAENRALMDRLVAEGSLVTLGYSLSPPGPEERSYVERNGTYYDVSIERGGEVRRERWILWFDLIEGDPPADAEVFTSSLGTGEPTDLRAEYGLSERDARVAKDAAGEIPTEFEYRDLEDAPPGQRGHVFLRRGPDETDLLPEPPFTHVEFVTGDGSRYARAVAERATVTLRRYEHAVERVADSADGYAAHVRDEHLRATFDPGALPDAQREILESITAGGGRYEEVVPLSDAMTTVLERLGLSDVETPEPKSVTFSEPAYFRYGDGAYAAELEIFR